MTIDSIFKNFYSINSEKSASTAIPSGSDNTHYTARHCVVQRLDAASTKCYSSSGAVTDL